LTKAERKVSSELSDSGYLAATDDLALTRATRSARWTRGILSFVKGAAIGVAANLAGLKAFDEKMNALSKDISQPREFVTPVGGGMTLDELDPEIKNGETYEIKVTQKKNAKGEPYNSYEINQVTDLTTIPGNASWMESDCTGKWADKEFGALSNYSPTKEKIAQVFGTDMGAILTSGYYSYWKNISDAATKNSISEDLLLALLTADGLAKFDGQLPNNCGNWLQAQTAGAGTQSIDCVASGVKAVLAKENAVTTFSTYFKELPESKKGIAVENANKAQQLWQSMQSKKQ